MDMTTLFNNINSAVSNVAGTVASVYTAQAALGQLKTNLNQPQTNLLTVQGNGGSGATLSTGVKGSTIVMAAGAFLLAVLLLMKRKG